MRSSLGGWVENIRDMLAPLRGLTMKRWEAPSATFIGRVWEADSNFCNARAKAKGSPEVWAPVASA